MAFKLYTVSIPAMMLTGLSAWICTDGFCAPDTTGGFGPLSGSNMDFTVEASTWSLYALAEFQTVSRTRFPLALRYEF